MHVCDLQLIHSTILFPSSPAGVIVSCPFPSLYNLMPTVPCDENGAVSTHNTHAHTDVYTLHHHTYRLTVSHDCLLQTIRAKCDLLQHLSVSHCGSVIPHLSLSSSTPASLHTSRFHCSCIVLFFSLQLISLFALFFAALFSSCLSSPSFFLLTFLFSSSASPSFSFSRSLFYL